jgi:hypothetical protein
MELVRDGKRPASWDDPIVKLAFDYVRAMDAAKSDAKRADIERRMPDVAAAFGLHLEAGVSRDEIEARLLAGESIATIAGKVGVPEQVIEAYEKLFFNVSESLRAMDWLTQEVVGIYVGMRRVPTRGETWKYMALAAGPAAVDMLVADYFGRDEPRLPDRSLLAQKARFLIWEITMGFSLPETAAVLAGYETLFLQQGDDKDSPARQELKQLVARLRMFVDLWASAVAGHEAEKRAQKKSKRHSHSVKTGRRTAPKESDHGRSHKETEGQEPIGQFRVEGYQN